MTMKTTDFDYYLPKEQIAQTPSEPRDSSRLLVYNRADGSIEHRIFRDITDYLRAGDVLVVNNTKVIPARIFAKRVLADGSLGDGECEVLLLKRLDYTVWDNALSELQMYYPQYKSIKLNVNNAQIAPNRKSTMRRTDTAKFNPANGKIEHIQHYQDLPKSQTLRGWFYAFHTGSWGGIWTKTLYFIAAIIGGTLPISGYYLWIKRIRKKQE